MDDIFEDVRTAHTPFGEVRYFGFDGPIGQSLALYGEWAMAEIRFARQFLRPGDTVIDGGANVGMHTLAFSAACGPAGRVISFEASPQVASLLQQTIVRNSLDNVELVTAALGDRESTCRFQLLENREAQNVGMLRVVDAPYDDQLTLEIPVRSIDSLRLRRLRMIKLDIEGQELAALSGAKLTIDRCRPVVLVEFVDLEKTLGVFSFMTSISYRAFFCSFGAFDEENYRLNQVNIFGFAREAGVLFVPDDSTPECTAGVKLLPVMNADALDQLLVEMPRYGDLTDHDRVK